MSVALAEAPVIGDILKRLSSGSSVIEWTIPDFFSLKKKNSAFYCSPEFHFLGKSWDLEIWTDCTALGWGKDWTAMRIWRKRDNEHSVKYTFGVKYANGEKDEIVRNQSFNREDKGSKVIKFLQWSDVRRLRSNLFPEDALTIICTLCQENPPSSQGQSTTKWKIWQMEDSAAGSSREVDNGNLCKKDQNLVPCQKETEDSSDESAKEVNVTHLDTKGATLQQMHLKDMLLKGQDHDVTFKVKNRLFRAHKNILRARSPIFAKMFTLDTKKAEGSDVTIEDCDPDIFGDFLEYVYIGRVQNLTPRKALRLYYVGDKYDFPHLKEMCVEFLKASLSIKVICDVIALAIERKEKELEDCAMVFFTTNLMDILPTDEWQCFLKHNSTLANELNVKAMKSYKKVK